MKLQLILLFNIFLIPFLLGQGIKHVPVEYYITASTQIKQQNFNTYSALVLDKHQALKKEKIKPNDIARNHLTLKELDKVADSADLRIYLYVGDYKQLKVETYTKKEKDPYTGLEINSYYKKVQYQLPIHIQVYNCSGSLIWQAAAEQNKVYYYGEGFRNEKDLEAVWDKRRVIHDRLTIEDGLIGQAKLWMEDLQQQIIPEKKLYKFSLLQPKDYSDYRDFQANVHQSESFLKNLHTYANHQATIKKAHTVITAWKALLPGLKNGRQKYYAAALYNLAYIYYSIDQLTEATEFALKSMQTRELKNYNKYLLRDIERTNQYFKKTGATSRQVYSYCDEFVAIEPSSIQIESSSIIQIEPSSIPIEPENTNSATIIEQEDLPNETASTILEDLAATKDAFKDLFKRDKPLQDGMVFLNNGQLLQGQIIGKITNTRSLRKRVLFAPLKKDGSLGEERKFKPSNIKKFVAKGKTYESHTVGTCLLYTSPSPRDRG